MNIDLCVISFRVVEKYLLHISIMCIIMLFICIKMFIENEFVLINVALYLTNNLWLIKLCFHCRLIITVCHVYIVILYALYDDVCMYKYSQIKVLFCSIHCDNKRHILC